jgi:hypothetical protein
LDGVITSTPSLNLALIWTKPQLTSRDKLCSFGVDELHEGIAKTGAIFSKQI